MELRGHHLGRISTPIGSNGKVQVDVGALIRRLLLIERCTVESIGLWNQTINANLGRTQTMTARRQTNALLKLGSARIRLSLTPYTKG